MYLLAPFILQNFKEFLRTNPELWGCLIFGPKMAHLSSTNFFWYKPLLSSTYWPFSLCKIEKITADPELWGCAIFGPKMVQLPQTNFFLENYYDHSRLLISPFHCAKFKKNSSSGSKFMRMHNIWAQNAHFLKREFFSENLLMSLISFTHAYLRAKNQSQILIY